MFIIALHLRRSCRSSRYEKLRKSMIRRRSKESRRSNHMFCRVDNLLPPHLFEVRSVCIRLHPFPSVSIRLQSGPGPVHNFYSTCLRRLVILRFSNPLAGPMVHTMLILGAKTGQKSVQKKAKTGVPATYGKSGFDMLFAVFQPCRTSRQNHMFVVIRGAKLGCERRSRKNHFQDTLWRLRW